MPTEDETLQRICEDVAKEATIVGLARLGSLTSDYAREVARRYAATVGAGVPEEVRDAMRSLTIDRSEPQPVEHDVEGWGAWTEWTVSGGEFKDEHEAQAVATVLHFVQDLLAPPSPDPSPSGQE